MPRTKMHELAALGQSLWIDNISRSMIASGKLKSLIEAGLRGQTSNPTIFKQAISTSSDYDQRILALTEAGKDAFAIYDDLTIKDVQDAADLFRGVYEATKWLDGYVSLEINPQMGNELEPQLKEGIRLWQKLNRPNVCPNSETLRGSQSLRFGQPACPYVTKRNHSSAALIPYDQSTSEVATQWRFQIGQRHSSQ